MFEYHDQPGDDHDHVAPPDTDAPDGPGADAFTEQHLPPLGDVPGHADTAPELHFPGDDVSLAADLDHAAPFPDDGDFAQWMAGHEDSGADAASEPLLTAPEDSDALPSSDALVDWTLRHLEEEG